MENVVAAAKAKVCLEQLREEAKQEKEGPISIPCHEIYHSVVDIACVCFVASLKNAVISDSGVFGRTHRLMIILVCILVC